MKKQYIYVFAIMLALGAAFTVLYGNFDKALAPSDPEKMETGNDPSKLPPLANVSDLVNVTDPKAGAKIQSPLTVKGFAKGTWYFEASFPVKIVDASGKIVGQGIAQAESDWMTEKFVPFSTTIAFSTKEGEKGELIFQKDNPSGLPEHDAEFRMPIIFGAETMPVAAYFGNTEKGSNDDCSLVFPVTRYITKTTAVANGAVLELLKGAMDEEKKEGYFTSINPGVKIQKLTISNGAAKIDLSDDIERAVGGSCRVTNIRAQIEKTLKQFSTVKSVIISVDGRTEDILQP